MKISRNKYPYGLNDRTRNKGTNKPVDLEFSSISRWAARTARSITISIWLM